MINSKFCNPMIVRKYSTCYICKNFMNSSYMTKCKHSFCKRCILNYLDYNNKCPICSTPLKKNEVYHNILAKFVRQFYNFNSLNGDLETKFQRKFEYADFLIELTIVKNYLKSIYVKKLEELKEFKAKISYLKKDIYFLNTLLNNDEEDFYIFMDKLLSVVNPSLFMDNKDSMNNSGEEHNHKRRHDNLEEQNQELFDDVNNKKVKLEHATEMLFDFDDEDVNLNDFNLSDNSYINYENVKNIITKVLNERIRGESDLKDLIIECYEKNFSKDKNTKKNSNINNNDDNQENDKTTPLVNPAMYMKKPITVDSNHNHDSIVEPVYLDVNFGYVDSSDENISVSSSGSVTNNSNSNTNVSFNTSSNKNNNNLELKNHLPEETIESSNKLKQFDQFSEIKNENTSCQPIPDQNLKLKNNIDYWDSTSSNTNHKLKYVDNTGELRKEKEKSDDKNDIINKNQQSHSVNEAIITERILKDINKEQKLLKNSLVKKMKNLLNRVRQINKNKNEIEKYYFDNQKEYGSSSNLKDQCYYISRFTNYMNKITQYTHFHTIANINYVDNFLNNSSCIVSSVEFDKNDDFFASAGVLKKIRIYDFNQVVFNYKDFYHEKIKEELNNYVNQCGDQPRHGKNKAEDYDDSYPSSSSSPYYSNYNTTSNKNKLQNLNSSSTSIPSYMTTLPNKIPLTSILLNPEIEIEKKNKTCNYYSNRSSNGTSSDICPSQNESNPLDYITRYPVQEIVCNSKISCLSYSCAKQSNLLSSDYEGIISLWDAETGVAISNYTEHEKRAWCVDYSHMNPTQFVSGSDDATVKIWDENVPYSTLTIDSRANICSVAFNPYNEYEIAFGSADHNIYYYDIRNAKRAWECIRGHKKAISYVKFRNKYEFVSASTDNTLKLWSINPYVIDNQMNNNSINNVNNNVDEKVQLLKTYSGHTNERNFAGLSISSNGDFILCGSETNEIYTYFAEFEKPIIVENFGNIEDAVTGSERDYCDTNQFISSLSWKKTSDNILIAANSEGCVKVYEMV